MTDKQELYDEVLPLIANRNPSGDPVRETNYPNGDSRTWFLCPSHPDGQKTGKRSASLSAKYGLDCFAGCDFQSIMLALRGGQPRPRRADADNVRQFRGRAPSASVTHEPRTPRTTRDSKLVAVYQYTTEDGTLVAEKGRFENPDGSKSFSWRVPGAADWFGGLGGLKMAEMPLYNAQALAEAPEGSEVWITEGEKDGGAIGDNWGALWTTHAGGASTKDFGPWVERLFKGKRFRLRFWSDNDEVGREYMERFRLAALPFADPSSSRVVVDVPHKGGAWEFISGGGTIEQAREGIIRTPVVQFLDERTLRVIVPTKTDDPSAPSATFTFDDIEKTTRALDCDMTVVVDGFEEPDHVPFNQRVNVLSGSQMTDTRRTLETIYGKTAFEWAKLLNKACSIMRQSFAQVDRSRDSAEAEEIEITNRWLIESYLHIGQFSILFGDGETAKSMSLLRMAICGSLQEPFIDGLDVAPGVGMYGDWETNFEDYGNRLKRIVRGLGYPQMPPGLLHYWPGGGAPLADQIDAIVEKCVRDHVQHFYIDSVGFACGSEPERAESAIRFKNAVDKLTSKGITVVGLAHVNKFDAKAKGGADKPFGSAFWNNAARRTIFVTRSQSPDQDVIHQAWYPKKVNNGRRPKPLGLELVFQGETGAITFERSEIKKSADIAASRSGWRERAWDALRDAPMPIHELHEALGLDTDADKTALRKMFERDAKAFAAGKTRSFVSFNRSGDNVLVWGRAI